MDKNTQLQAPGQQGHNSGNRGQEFEAAAFAVASAGDRLESVIAELYAATAAQYSGFFAQQAHSAATAASAHTDKAAAFAQAASEFASGAGEEHSHYTMMFNEDGGTTYIYEYNSMQGGSDVIRGFTHVPDGVRDVLRFENMLHDGDRELDNLLASPRWDAAAQAAVMENGNLRFDLSVDALQATLHVTDTSAGAASQTIVLENCNFGAAAHNAVTPEDAVHLMQEIVKITS